MKRDELEKAILARYDRIATGPAALADKDSGLGCARLTELVQVFPQETVLDVGSGPGLEAIELARRADPALVYGLDALPSMVRLAEDNARKAGVSNVRFLVGKMDDIPLESESVDVVVSNCVINLSQDKERVMREIWRVLRPGGRLCMADTAWLSSPPAWVREAPEAWACCVGGALEATEYPPLLERAGFVDVELNVLGAFDTSGKACCGSTCNSGGALRLGSALVGGRKPGGPPPHVEITEASPQDLDLMLRILRAAFLPTEGVRDHLPSFLLARSPDGKVVGVAGLERYRGSALLRSLVVLPAWRRRGLGRRLVDAQLASLSPGTPVYLLTQTAEEYFASLGFERVAREDVPAEVKESYEFRGACPDSAIVLRLATPSNA